MKSSFNYGGMAILALAVVLGAASTATSAGQNTALVRLQAGTPGVAQSGNFNITGTARAGTFAGSGAGLTGVPAASLTGTISDALLSANVALLNTDQTFTGVKTFSSAPSFTAAGIPFAVGSSTKVTNLNADLLDGLTSASFLQSIPNPLSLSFAVDNGSVIEGINNGTTAQSVGVYGESQSSFGRGVVGRSTSATGWAGYFTGGQGLYASRISIGSEEPSTIPLQFGTGDGEKIALKANTVHGIAIRNGDFQIHSDFDSDIVLGHGALNGFAEKVRIVAANGRVGIGTSTPAYLLDVNGSMKAQGLTLTTGAANNTVLLGNANGFGTWGQIDNTRLVSDRDSFSKVTASAFSINSNGDMLGANGNKIALYTGATQKVKLDPNGSDGGFIGTYGSNGSQNVKITNLGGFPNFGYVAVYDNVGANKARMYVDSAGDGIVEADVKNFVEPDPEDPTMNIVYACPEGPEAAMYVRGTGQLVRGEARITLPDHFRKLASTQGITIFLTPHGRKSRGLTYEDASPSSFSVFELDNGSGSYTFDWEVKAVRKGYENYRVYRPWNESLAAGEGDEQWRARLKSIENKKNRGGKP